jgi:hypothetical protein
MIFVVGEFELEVIGVVVSILPQTPVIGKISIEMIETTLLLTSLSDRSEHINLITLHRR